ncbi:2273_t:CDS:2 [Rhizophagus irregularis]|nr:2273_t:CDS:2 [Rhizophagus irregularis]
MKKYLTQPIHDAHYKQMCQSVCYFMRQVSIAEAPTLDDNSFEPIFDGKDSAETFAKIDEDRELDLQSLMAMVNINDIIEIWKISRYNYPKTYQFVILLSTVFVESSKARFHLTLIPCRWYKDEYISSSEGYFNEKAESVKQQRALANQLAENDNQVICRLNGVLIESNQVLDPLKHQPKGRSPGKRFKSSTELKSKSKSEATDGGRKCGLCGGNGHYHSTCPSK